MRLIVVALALLLAVSSPAAAGKHRRAFGLVEPVTPALNLVQSGAVVAIDVSFAGTIRQPVIPTGWPPVFAQVACPDVVPHSVPAASGVPTGGWTTRGHGLNTVYEWLWQAPAGGECVQATIGLSDGSNLTAVFMVFTPQ